MEIAGLCEMICRLNNDTVCILSRLHTIPDIYRTGWANTNCTIALL